MIALTTQPTTTMRYDALRPQRARHSGIHARRPQRERGKEADEETRAEIEAVVPVGEVQRHEQPPNRRGTRDP